MDDMKREIYLLALEKINKGKTDWVCLALKDAAAEILGYTYGEIFDALLEELLPEFFQLFDGVAWYRTGILDDDEIDTFTIPDRAYCAPWWQRSWKEPRVRILNYILMCK